MTISAEVVADSCHKDRPELRISTVKVTFPRYILAEVNTHRVFSRSYSSSRAIPVKRMVANIRKDPAMPVHWGSNRPGMQAGAELTGWRLSAIKGLWLGGMWIMTSLALAAARVGVHKQVVNRMVEPWAHVTGIITSTEWANFFALRKHPDADPTFNALATEIYRALLISVPKKVDRDGWHLPFIAIEDEIEQSRNCNKRDTLSRLMTISTARCARASYANFDGKRSTYREDRELSEKLAASSPPHASPYEHQATPTDGDGFYHNLRGWRSQRSFMARESLPGWPPEMVYRDGR